MLVALAWALWLGGLIALFLAVQAIFHRSFPGDRHLAGTAAAGIFHVFEKYQLGLAAAALLFTFLWRLQKGAPRLKTLLFMLFGVVTVLAVVETLAIAPKIDALRLEGMTSGDDFKRLHGISMMVYAGEALLLLAGAFILPILLRRDGSDRN